MGDHWYRVQLAKDGATHMALLVIVLTLTVASSLAIRLFLGIRALERRAIG